MWHHVDIAQTDVSEERITSILRVEEGGCGHLLTLVPRSWIFHFSSTLKMEAIRCPETSVYTMSTRRHIPEDGILHGHKLDHHQV
jgi:hypothetical protein